jgi:hypothetical protein
MAEPRPLGRDDLDLRLEHRQVLRTRSEKRPRLRLIAVPVLLEGRHSRVDGFDLESAALRAEDLFVRRLLNAGRRSSLTRRERREGEPHRRDARGASRDGSARAAPH